MDREHAPAASFERMAFDEYQRMFALTPEELREPILDVGAGEGGFIKYVRQTLGNRNAYGVEIAPSETSMAERDSGLIVSDGRRLPFPDHAFGIVIAKEYVPMFLDRADPMAPVHELLRVTRPGGTVLFHWMPRESITSGYEDASALTKKWLARRLKGTDVVLEELDALRKRGFTIETRTSLPGHEVVVITTPR